ncbi:MAG: hypothetical protein ACOYLB_15610 [Phototrophicaceae bacterium]
MSNIEHGIGWLFFQLPVNQSSLDQLIGELKRNKGLVAERIAKAGHTTSNHGWAAHIIGIEIWCQHKAQGLLDGSDYSGDYDPFRPANDVPYETLKPLFEQTRYQTLALAERLKEVPSDKTVAHNQWGNFNAKGWLNYINKHAGISSLAIR